MKAPSNKPNTLRDLFSGYTEVVDDPQLQIVGVLGRIAEAALLAMDHPEAHGRNSWRELQLELEYREALSALDEARGEDRRDSDEALAYIVIDVADGHN